MEKKTRVPGGGGGGGGGGTTEMPQETDKGIK